MYSKSVRSNGTLDYSHLFEERYLLLNDAERLREMRDVSRKPLKPMVMLALLLAILHTRS